MNNFKCHIQVDEGRLYAESLQDDPIVGILQEAGWMHAVTLEHVEAEDEGYVCVISADNETLLEESTCDSVEDAIEQEFAWLGESGIYLDALTPIQAA